MTSRPLTDFEQILLGIIAAAPSSGYALKKHLAASPAGVYQPSSGALYPALQRLEAQGAVSAEWGTSENNRKARFYKLTAKGRKELVSETSRWRRIAMAIGHVLGPEEGGA